MKSAINRALAAKKKNYIAPTTEMINLASQGIMQSLNIVTASGTSFGAKTLID